MAYIGRTPAYGAFEKQSITADGSTTTFALDFTVGSSSSIMVSIAGVMQEPETAYSISGGGTNIVFSTAPTSGGELKKIQASNVASDLDIDNTTALAEEPASGDKFIVYDATAGANRAVEYQYINPTLTYTNGTFTGDGSTTTITIDSGRAVDDVMVSQNGFLLVPTDDYTISGTTLTFTTAPTSGAEISVRYLPLAGASSYTNDTATGDGSTTAFTIDSGRSVEDVMVSVNGVLFVPSDDYTISGTTLTFSTAPASSAEISIRYLRLT